MRKLELHFQNFQKFFENKNDNLSKNSYKKLKLNI